MVRCFYISSLMMGSTQYFSEKFNLFHGTIHEGEKTKKQTGGRLTQIFESEEKIRRCRLSSFRRLPPRAKTVSSVLFFPAVLTWSLFSRPFFSCPFFLALFYCIWFSCRPMTMDGAAARTCLGRSVLNVRGSRSRL